MTGLRISNSYSHESSLLKQPGLFGLVALVKGSSFHKTKINKDEKIDCFLVLLSFPIGFCPG